MITIRDVAKEANVSVGTVSNVLNELPSVKNKNKEKVMEAIKRLEYKPNVVARMLKTNISNTICLILPDITNPFYPEVAREVEAAAQEVGYILILANSDRSAKNERTVIQRKRIWRVHTCKYNFGAVLFYCCGLRRKHGSKRDILLEEGGCLRMFHPEAYARAVRKTRCGSDCRA